MKKILLDLSTATLGYGGIQQDSRLLWKTLKKLENLQVDGLIYSIPRKIVSKPRDLKGSAISLAEIFSDLPNSRFPRIQKYYEQYKYLESILRKNDKHLYEISKENNFAVWSQCFEKSLNPEDLESILNSEFFLARVNNWQINLKSAINAPKVSFDTSNYQFAIFQLETYRKVSPKTKKIVRFHDAIPLRNPQFFETSGFPRLQGTALALSSNDSYFVCNSEESRRQLLSYFPQNEERSSVIPYALSDAYRPELNVTKARDIALRRMRKESTRKTFWEIGQKYIISVSTLEPRKNYPRLIQAWENLGEQAPALVIVANKGWKSEESLRAMRPHLDTGRFFHLENLTPDELRIMYSNSEGLAFISLDEGFGFTPMEAMSCGVPTLVSDIPAHREVMGSASLYCNPIDPEDIREGLLRLINLGREKNALVDAGFARVKEYSNEKTGEMWLELLEKLDKK
jgi:glycosyltransferase involved in cell wall biosynthesis